MNKVMLMGRLTRDPEVRYSQSAEPIAITRYSLAVNRRFKRDGEPDADFINCVAFGKAGDFSGKYFKKGMMVAVVGRLQVRSWDDQQTGQKRWATEVVVEEQHFAESKASFESGRSAGSDNYSNAAAKPSASQTAQSDGFDMEGFSAIAESIDDEELPF